jgi:hypothetical protein
MLEFYDLTGRILERRSLDTGEGNLSLKVAGLGSGIYFVKISSSEGSVIKKVLISR